MIGDCILLPESSSASGKADERQLYLFSQSVQRGRRLLEADERSNSQTIGEVLKKPQKWFQFLSVLIFEFLKISFIPMLFFSITLSYPLMRSQRQTVTADKLDDFASSGEISYDQISALVGESTTVRPLNNLSAPRSLTISDGSVPAPLPVAPTPKPGSTLNVGNLIITGK